MTIMLIMQITIVCYYSFIHYVFNDQSIGYNL